MDNKLRELLAARNAKWDAAEDKGEHVDTRDPEQVALMAAAAKYAREVTQAEWVPLPGMNCIDTARKGSTPHLTVCAVLVAGNWRVMVGRMDAEAPDLLDALRAIERRLAEALASVRALGVSGE